MFLSRALSKKRWQSDTFVPYVYDLSTIKVHISCTFQKGTASVTAFVPIFGRIKVKRYNKLLLTPLQKESNVLVAKTAEISHL